MITPVYAAILALIFIFLSFRTLRLRHRFRVAIGTGENETLSRAARVHSNFAEYVPLALILIYFLESETGAKISIHVLCIALIAGRLLHAYGLSQIAEDFRFRVVGMVLTLACIIFASLWLLANSVV